MTGRWRLFRHDAGRAAGPPAWVYLALFVGCLGLGFWSVGTFGAVMIWPANGVLLAALLQLHRRQAMTVLMAAFAINLLSNVYRGDPQPFVWMNAVLNMGQVLLGGASGAEGVGRRHRLAPPWPPGALQPARRGASRAAQRDHRHDHGDDAP